MQALPLLFPRPYWGTFAYGMCLTQSETPAEGVEKGLFHHIPPCSDAPERLMVV